MLKSTGQMTPERRRYKKLRERFRKYLLIASRTQNKRTRHSAQGSAGDAWQALEGYRIRHGF